MRWENLANKEAIHFRQFLNWMTSLQIRMFWAVSPADPSGAAL